MGSPIYNKSMEKELARSKARGKVEYAQHIIHKYLTHRFGLSKPYELCPIVREISHLEILDCLFTELLKVSAFEEAKAIVDEGLECDAMFQNGSETNYSIYR